MNRDHTFIEYRVRTHTYHQTHLHVSTKYSTHTVTYIVSHHSKSFALLPCMGACSCVSVHVCACCCCVYILLGFKMKVNQSCTWLLLLLLLLVGCLSLFFFQSLFGFLCLTLLFGLIFSTIQYSLSLFSVYFIFFPFMFAHTKTHNTIHSLTWMQKK